MAGTQKRDRGRILTDSGYKKIWAAIRQQFPDRQTYAAIARWTEPDQKNLDAIAYITAETVSKIITRRDGVDQKSIEHLFIAFKLTLQDNDHTLFREVGRDFSNLNDPNFIGREDAFSDLEILVEKGAKIIVIKAAGGVGKTTLARKYLQQKFDFYIEFPIAKETKDIATIEALLEEKLRQLGEEPARDLIVSLERLKRKLKSDSIGILIDNLEPALGANRGFIEEHRGYLELLRMLASEDIQSITLITSRERMREPAVSLIYYNLEGLDVSVWKQFFAQRKINVDTPSIQHLHHAYAGNAKAMDLIRSSILEDCNGDTEKYWYSNKDDLLINGDLESLVASQFSRLKNLDIAAYNLLVRMGCYRYQDVPNIAEEGLFCLLWDISSDLHRRVIKSLQDRSLIDSENGKFLLHPVIRAESIKNLRENEDWKKSNKKAAEYWRKNIDDIKEPSDALEVLEGFYHHVSIENWNGAAKILVDRKFIDSKAPNRQSLIGVLRGFGMHLNCLNALNIITAKCEYLDQITRGDVLAYRGDTCFVLGYSKQSIESYKQAIAAYDISDLFSICDSLSALALSYMGVGEYELSIENFEKVIGFEEKLKAVYSSPDVLSLSTRILAGSYASLSLLCLWKNEDKKASEYLQVALKLSPYNQQMLGSWWENYGNYNLARALIIMGYEDQARHVAVYLYRHYKAKSDPMSKGLALSISAEIYSLFDFDFTKAIKNLKSAIEIFRYLEVRQQLAEALFKLSLLYKNERNLEDSQILFCESISLFDGIDAPNRVREIEAQYND